MAILDRVEYKSLQNGLICEGAVSEHRQPIDSVTESINFHFDRIGSAKLRPGLTLLGNQLSGNLLGLYNFRDSGAGTNNQIIAVNGTVAYYLSGSTWTSKRSGLTASSKARFSTFLDYAFMVNGADATAIWDGATGNNFVTTGNAASAPIGKFIENFRSRMWIAGNSTYPDRLYFSSTPSSVTTPIITWDTDVATGQWIDISPSDGENITALKRTKGALLVFKNNHIYRIYSINGGEPDPQFNVGTYSQESVVEAKDGVYFHHPTGIYKYNGGVEEISRPVSDFINAITVANLSKICGWADEDHVYFAIGNITANGISYTNMVLRYTISTKVWTHGSYPRQWLVSSPYNDGTTLFNLVGDDNGNVLKVNVGNTDNTTPIFYSLVSRWHNIDGLLATEKNIIKMLFAHKGGAESVLSYQIQNDEPSDWTKTIGQLTDVDKFLDNADIRGRKCRFRLHGTSKGEPFTYDGFEILESESELINF